MLRLVVRVHAFALLAVFSAIFFAPSMVLDGLGVPVSNETHSLLRVMSCLLAVIAAASYALPELPQAARRTTLLALGIAYAATAFMVMVQWIAIWQGPLGATLAGAAGALSAAFGWLAYQDRPTMVSGR